MRLAAGFAFTVLLGACASTSEPDLPPTVQTSEVGPPAELSIMGNVGAEIGKATFTAAPQGVLIRILVPAGGLSPGSHGTHLHMVGDCSDTAPAGYIHSHRQMKCHDPVFSL